jgi:3D (Asp-Asp-Asp) domain-containing protein
MRFVATAYCHGTTTAAGVRVRDGIVAADPHVLPLGTVIRLKSAGPYNGTYTVLDTGAMIQGRRLDVFIRDCGEAVRFGRRDVSVSIIRHKQ